jgi:hypothetical protein
MHFTLWHASESLGTRSRNVSTWLFWILSSQLVALFWRFWRLWEVGHWSQALGVSYAWPLSSHSLLPFCHDVNCSVMHYDGLSALKPWAKINLSLLKLFLSGIWSQWPWKQLTETEQLLQRSKVTAQLGGVRRGSQELNQRRVVNWQMKLASPTAQETGHWEGAANLMEPCGPSGRRVILGRADLLIRTE